MGLTIFQKGLILVAVPFVVQVASFLVIADGLARQSKAREWASHSKQVTTQAQRVLTLMLDAEAAVRGYLLTSHPLSVARFEGASGEVKEALSQLRSLVADNPEQDRRAEAFSEHALDLVAQRRVILKLADENKAQALARIRQLEDRKESAVLRADIHSFIEAEESLEAERATLEFTARSRLNWILLGNACLTFVVTLLLGSLFATGIRQRVQVLTDNAQRLAQNKELRPPLPGNDEIARIDLAFHDMARSLAEAGKAEKRYLENLEVHVRERTEELDRINQELRHNYQENELFVYSVSHDLRAPLVNLQGFSRELALACKDLRKLLHEPGVPEDVRNRCASLIDKDVHESIHFITNGVTRLGSIIDSLLRLSRAGRVVYQSQLVDVAGIVRRVVESLRLTIEERGITIAVQHLPAAWGDAAALEQVFANLVSNAIKYLDRERPGVIEIGWQKLLHQGQRVEAYYVKDNGLGIAEAYQDKIFQAFQRVHADHAPGDGMGLAIVRRVVERHHGRVWVESKPNEGSIFYVTLPGRRSAERNDVNRTDDHLVGGRR